MAMEGKAVTVGEDLLGWTSDPDAGEVVTDCSAFSLPVKVSPLINEYGNCFGLRWVFRISTNGVGENDSPESVLVVSSAQRYVRKAYIDLLNW